MMKKPGNAVQEEMDRRQTALERVRTYSRPAAKSDYPGPGAGFASDRSGPYQGTRYGSASGKYLPYSQRATYAPYQGSSTPGSDQSGQGSGTSSSGNYIGSDQYYSSDQTDYRTGFGRNPANRTYNMEGTAPRKEINEEYSYRGMSPEAYNGGGGDRAAGRQEWGFMDERNINTRQQGTSPGYWQDYNRPAMPAKPERPADSPASSEQQAPSSAGWRDLIGEEQLKKWEKQSDLEYGAGYWSNHLEDLDKLEAGGGATSAAANWLNQQNGNIGLDRFLGAATSQHSYINKLGERPIYTDYSNIPKRPQGESAYYNTFSPGGGVNEINLYTADHPDPDREGWTQKTNQDGSSYWSWQDPNAQKKRDQAHKNAYGSQASQNGGLSRGWNYDKSTGNYSYSGADRFRSSSSYRR